ncbi:hypothetical protein DV735_g787, partial [Chaetothyriales sp. CBS 134920]
MSSRKVLTVPFLRGLNNKETSPTLVKHNDCVLMKLHPGGMAVQWRVIASALVALATAVSSQQILPSAASSSFPACGLSCAVLITAQSTCASSFPAGTAQLTYENCFCTQGTVQPLYASPDGLCTAECTAAINSHWQWVMMLGILAVGLGLLTWFAIWLKHRQRRKMEAQRIAMSGFPSPTEKRDRPSSAAGDMWGPHQHMHATNGWEYQTDPAKAAAEGRPTSGGRQEKRRSKRDSGRSSQGLSVESEALQSDSSRVPLAAKDLLTMADRQGLGLANLSVVPYDSNREVILRNEEIVVYRDPLTQRLAAVPRHRDLDPRLRRPAECPTCHRTWNSTPPVPTPDIGLDAPAAEDAFMSQNYFQALAISLAGPSSPVLPPSPHRQLVQPVRSRLESPSSPPPADAEFVRSSPAPTSAGSNAISETAFSPGYFEKFFMVEKELGRGGRGIVLLVQHLLDGVPLGHFACKRLPIGDDHAWLEKVLIEVQVLTSLSHQNLVSYRHVWLEDFQINAFSPRVPCAFILQQYCNGGDLHNYVCSPAQITTSTQQLKERIRRRSKGEAERPIKPNEPRRLPFDQIYSFFSDITAGLRFLHMNGFIHRDLKPRNCLLHTVGNETRVLVSDFGEVQYENAARKSTGATGTVSYCAPEVLRRISADGPYGNFTTKSDIFSLGMILYFLCFASLPYVSANVLFEEREDVDKLRAEILEWTGFDDHRRLRPELPQQLYAFLKRLLSVDPDSRPSADDVNQGIIRGHLSDTVPPLRRRRSSAAEELTPGRSSWRQDNGSEAESSPWTAGIELDLGAALRHNNTRSHSRSRERSRLTQAPSAIVDDPDYDKADSQASETELASASVILRPKHPLPSAANATHAGEDADVVQPLLLPPPHERVLWPSISNLLHSEISSTALRGLILVVKLMTALQPCMAQGLNVAVVYPLITLAAIEMTVPQYQLWKATLFGVEEERPRPPSRPSYRLGHLSNFVPLNFNAEESNAYSTRGGHLQGLIKTWSATPKRPTSLYSVDTTTDDEERGFFDGAVDASPWRRSGYHSDTDPRRASIGPEILMTPQMRSMRLIGNSNPRYRWQQYYKTEEELNQMRKPIREYYERCNYLIAQYLYIDKLLDSSLPHTLIQEYHANSLRQAPMAPISEEPLTGSSPPNDVPEIKVKRTPKNIYALPKEDTPLLQQEEEEAEDVAEGYPDVPLDAFDEALEANDPVVTLAIYVNLTANVVLLAAKIAVMVLTSSLSVLASLVDAALDFLSTAIVWTTTKLISHQDQYAYPIGRRRLEPVGVLVFSVIMITSFVQVGLECLQRLFSDDHSIVSLGAPAIAIMLSTIIIKGACWFWCRLVKNSSVQALAQDAMTDVVFNTFSIIFPLVGFYAKIWWMDALGGLLLSFYVIINWSITSAEHVRNLCGAAATADQRNVLLYLTMRFARTIRYIQGLQAYHTGDKLNVEVDIVLDEHTSLRDSHDLAESLQYVLESVPTVDRAFVHTDYTAYNLSTHMNQQGD